MVTNLVASTSDAVKPSTRQLKAVADGVVSVGEYERGVSATITCLVDEGMSVQGPHPGGPDNLELRYTFGFADGTGSLDEAVTVHVRCYQAHLVLIDDLYVAQLYGPTTLQELADCFRATLAGDVAGLSDTELIEMGMSDLAALDVADCLPHETILAGQGGS